MKNTLQPMPAFVYPDVSHNINKTEINNTVQHAALSTEVQPSVKEVFTNVHHFPTFLVSLLVICLFVLLFFLWVLKKIRMRDEDEWG